MKSITTPTSWTTTKLVAALALAASVSCGPSRVWAADQDVHEDRAEMRIKDMHGKLNIQPGQERQWLAVAKIMRDNAIVMDKLTQSRMDHVKDATAVDDLKSYGEISVAHAEGIKQLTPAFTTLYDAMSDAQKKQADLFFREGNHEQGGSDKDAKTSMNK